MIRATLPWVCGCSGLSAACAVGPIQSTASPAYVGFAPRVRSCGDWSSQSARAARATILQTDLDIPGEWWTLFNRRPHALIERALTNSPTLEAAEAALRRPTKPLARNAAATFPACQDRRACSAKRSRRLIWCPRSQSIIYNAQQRHAECLLYVGCLWRHPAPG